MPRKLWLLAAALCLCAPAAPADETLRNENTLRSCIEQGDQSAAPQRHGDGRGLPASIMDAQEIRVSYSREMQARNVSAVRVNDLATTKATFTPPRELANAGCRLQPEIADIRRVRSEDVAAGARDGRAVGGAEESEGPAAVPTTSRSFRPFFPRQAGENEADAESRPAVTPRRDWDSDASPDRQRGDDPAGMRSPRSPRGGELPAPRDGARMPRQAPLTAETELHSRPAAMCPLTQPRSECRDQVATDGPAKPGGIWSFSWFGLKNTDGVVERPMVAPAQHIGPFPMEPAPLAVAIPAGIVKTPDGTIHVHSRTVDATADRILINPNMPAEILLEGRVDLQLRTEGEPARILTGRAILNLNDGTYEVMPENVGQRFSPIGVAPAVPASRAIPSSVPAIPSLRSWR